MKKFISSIVIALMVSATCMVTTGCPTQSTDALLATTVGIGVSSYFAVEGNTAAANKATQLFGILSSDIANLKAGSNVSLAEQAGTDVVNFLSAEEPDSKPIAEIDIAITTVLGIISDFSPQKPVALTAAVRARTAQAPAPKTAAEFKAQWNAIPGNPAPLK